MTQIFVGLMSALVFVAYTPKSFASCEKIMTATEYENVRVKTNELLALHQTGHVQVQALKEFRAQEIIARTIHYKGDAEGLVLLAKLDASLREAIHQPENEVGSHVTEIETILNIGAVLIKTAESSRDREEARKVSQDLTMFRANRLAVWIEQLKVNASGSMDYLALVELDSAVSRALSKLVAENPPLTPDPANPNPNTPVVTGVNITVTLMPDPRDQDYWHPPRYPRGYDGRGGIL